MLSHVLSPKSLLNSLIPLLTIGSDILLKKKLGLQFVQTIKHFKSCFSASDWHPLIE